jgi:hypothetical protein
MKVPIEFIRAWRTWRHSSSPYSNDYLLNKDVATGKVEHDLDHMESYLYGIGLDVIEGKDYEYAEIAGRELSDLERIGSELESCDVAESEKEIFRKHIGIVRAVWLEIQKFGNEHGAT